MKRTLIAIAALTAFHATGLAQLENILAPVEGTKSAPAAGQPAQPPEPSATPAAHTVTGDDLLALLQKRLTEHFAINGELKLGFVRPWQTVKLPDAEFDVTITQFPPDGVSGSFLVRCKIVSAAQTVGEWQIPLRAQIWQEVWVASGRLDRGQALDRTLLSAQKVDVLRDRESLISTSVDPAVYETAQSIPAGRALMKRDIIERPVIRKGQVVEVVASQGLLAVSMKAQALESGIANALIKMRNLESRKEFTAQILNEGQVRVHF